MTNTNTNPVAAAMLNLNAQKDAGIIVDQGRTARVTFHNGTYGAGDYVEMKIGRRKFYLVRTEKTEGVRAMMFDATRRLMLEVGVDENGEFYIGDARYIRKTSAGVWNEPIQECGWATDCFGGFDHNIVDSTHKRATAMRKFAINAEPELRITIKALSTIAA